MDQQKRIALCGMDEATRSLVGLYCSKPLPEMPMKNWFLGVTFEALRPEVTCMAAALTADHDYQNAPPELTPRLRGIMRYVHTLNSGMTAGLCALGKRLNEAGIPAVLLGSTAVHLGYAQPPRRHIWQTEICVPEADFSRAAALAAEEGFTVQTTPYSATARCGNTQCIIIRKGMCLTQQTAPLTVNGVAFQMPGSGELLVDLAEAVFRLLLSEAPGAKLLPWIMDLHRVITADPDWDQAATAAAMRNTAAQVRLVLELYNSLVPNGLNKNILDNLGSEDAATRLAQLVPKYRKLKPNGSKLKRLWLSSQIRSEGASFAAMKVFFQSLRQSLVRKFTPGD